MVLSNRGKKALKPSLSYLDCLFKTFSDIHDIETNPKGYISMAASENKLSFAEVNNRLIEAQNSIGKKKWENKFFPFYDDMKGKHVFRANLVLFFKHFLENNDYDIKYDYDFENMMAFTGCGNAVESLAWVFCEEGDSCIIPAPYYPGFDNDLFVKSGVISIPAFLTHDDSMQNWKLTVESLEKAYNISVKDGHQPKMLLLTNPQNPLGLQISEKEILDALRWARSKNLQILSDEVYAQSVHSFRKGDVPFISMLDVAFKESKFQKLGDDVHIIYGVSKDFGLSGFRVGFLYTENPEFRKAIDNLNYFACVSSLTQEVLNEIFADINWMKSYFQISNKALSATTSKIMSFLDNIDIPYIRPNSGLYIVIDLRALLESDSWDAERHLFLDFFENEKLLLTPGKDCHFPEPGFFRVCFGAVSPESMDIGLQRLANKWKKIQNKS